MNRQNVIILTNPDKEPEAFGNFKKLCENKGFPYHSLKAKEFPIQYKEFTIYRVPFN